MPKSGFKTITVSEKLYNKLEIAAKRQKRPIANYLEYLFGE